MVRQTIILTVFTLAILPGVRPAAGDTPVGEPDAEDLAVILQEMETAGLPPTTEEQAEWRKEMAAAKPESAGLFGTGFAGTWSMRAYGQGLGMQKWDTRLDLAAGPVRIKGRYGRNAAGDQMAGGSLMFAARSSKLVAGYLGQEAGAGLLLAAPGRGSSLAADGKLGGARTRIVRWASVPESKTILGVGVETRMGDFTMLGLGGRFAEPGDGPTDPVQALTVMWQRRSLGLAVSGLKIGPSGGLSLWCQKDEAFLAWSGEAALWQGGKGKMPSLSWQMAVSAHPGKQWLVQVGVSGCGGGAQSPLGQRSALLGGDEGLGWVVLGSWRPMRGTELALLGAETHFRSENPDPRLDQTRTWDFIGGAKASKNFKISFRLRVTSRQRWSWSERYRWQPASRMPLEKRFQGQCRLAWSGKGGSVTASVKFLHRETLGVPGLRALTAFSGNWSLGRRAQIRAGSGTSWGDPLDLVSAVSPVPGLVVPRHWGSWQSETYLGLAVKFWGLGIQSAVSRRQPVLEAEVPPNTQYWLEVRRAW